MAQLTIYIDEETLKKIEFAAKQEHKSISKWVKSRIETFLNKSWPEDYSKLFGSLSEDDLKIPEELKFDMDQKRPSL